MSKEDDAFNPLAKYQQVEQFDSDLEEEYEEEETLYITLDMGQLDPNLLPNSTSYKLIGLETPTPFLQIGGSTFKGDYETLLGTEIILQDAPQGERTVFGRYVYFLKHGATPFLSYVKAGSSSSSRTLQPLATTSNRIRFREVHLVPETYPREDDNASNADTRVGDARSKTLGGVSREKPASFFPIASKDKGVVPIQNKGKRRWRKRPEGYHTSDEEKGEKTPAPGEGSVGSERPQEGGEDTEINEEGMDVELEGENGP